LTVIEKADVATQKTSEMNPHVLGAKSRPQSNTIQLWHV